MRGGTASGKSEPEVRMSEKDRYEALHADEIVLVLTRDHYESPSGHVESWTEEVVFKRGGKCFSAEINYSVNMFKMGEGRGATVHNEKAISNAEYDRRAEGREPDDIAGVKANIAQVEKEKAEYEASRPGCPKCGKKMTRRSSQYGQFWGCSAYPKCDGKRR